MRLRRNTSRPCWSMPVSRRTCCRCPVRSKLPAIWQKTAVRGLPARNHPASRHEDRDIKVPLRDRMLEMKGLPFLRTWLLPNFYFHIVTTYAILRHNGTEIG